MEQTQDIEWLRSVVTHPRVWRWTTEDGQESCDPPMWGTYLRHGDSGFLAFYPWTRNTWDAHVCMLPGAVGVARMCQESFDWMRERGAAGFIARIPSDARHVLTLARSCGFTECGRVRRCFLRRGRLFDLVLMEK